MSINIISIKPSGAGKTKFATTPTWPHCQGQTSLKYFSTEHNSNFSAKSASLKFREQCLLHGDDSMKIRCREQILHNLQTITDYISCTIYWSMHGWDLVKAHLHAVFSPHPKSYSFAMTHLYRTESPHLNVGSYQYNYMSSFEYSMQQSCCQSCQLATLSHFFSYHRTEWNVFSFISSGYTCK